MSKMKYAAAAALCASLSPAMAASTPAAPPFPFLDVLVYQYANCVKPAYHQADILLQDGAGRYQIDVKGEAYTVELQERMGFSLQAGIDGPVAAVIKLDRPPTGSSRSRRAGASAGCATWPSAAAWRWTSGRLRAARAC